MPLEFDDIKEAVRRVQHDERVQQWTECMEQKAVIDQMPSKAQDPAAAKHKKLLDWARERKHSQVKSQPLWIARTGVYDGAVHLPSNLVGWVVEQLFSLAKEFCEVKGRANAPEPGCNGCNGHV